VAGSIGVDAGSGARRLPGLSVKGVSVTEGDSGSVDAVFTLRLSAASRHPVSARVETGDDSARAGSDYRAHRGTVRFRPGQRSAIFRVKVLGDIEPETAETFSVDISRPKGARLRTRGVTGTIGESDLPAPFTVQATLSGADEVDDPPSPAGRGTASITFDAAQKQMTFTLTVTGMPLGDSGLGRGAPRRPFTMMVSHFGDPGGSSNTLTGTKSLELKDIVDIYKAPQNFCARATTPTRSEFIRGQFARS
jgi:Calx-beta domain-containing protein/CHRD domain-containing protein